MPVISALGRQGQESGERKAHLNHLLSSCPRTSPHIHVPQATTIKPLLFWCVIVLFILEDPKDEQNNHKYGKYTIYKDTIGNINN